MTGSWSHSLQPHHLDALLARHGGQVTVEGRHRVVGVRAGQEDAVGQ